MAGSHADNPQRLALIREGDALLIVLAGFAGGDPANELSRFREEILFADLGVITNRVERLEASIKKPRPDREALAKELELVKVVQDVLEQGKTVASLELSDEDKKPMRSFGLLTDKPQVVVLNAPQGHRIPDALRTLGARGAGDRRQARARTGPARRRRADRVHGRSRHHRPGPRSDHTPRVRRGRDHHVLHRRRARGPRLEPRRGANAVEAAGKIHTDLAKGFIRAEVTYFDDLRQAGSLKEAKAKHLQRLEGKDYVVKDGDVIYFRSAL